VFSISLKQSREGQGHHYLEDALNEGTISLVKTKFHSIFVLPKYASVADDN
jgi:hypothetical protein